MGIAIEGLSAQQDGQVAQKMGHQEQNKDKSCYAHYHLFAQGRKLHLDCGADPFLDYSSPSYLTDDNSDCAGCRQ